MAAYASTGFEIGNVLDARAYPTARRNRTGPAPNQGQGAPAGAAPASAYPRTRVFPFSVQVGVAGRRSATSTPRILGPSIIKAIHCSVNGGPTGNFGWGLGRATARVSEQDVVTTTAPPYAFLFEGLPQIGAGPSAANNVDVLQDVQNPCPLMDDDGLHFVVPDAEWFLVVYAVGGSVARTVTGHVTVLEQVDAQSLAFYVG